MWLGSTFGSKAIFYFLTSLGLQLPLKPWLPFLPTPSFLKREMEHGPPSFRDTGLSLSETYVYGFIR